MKKVSKSKMKSWKNCLFFLLIGLLNIPAMASVTDPGARIVWKEGRIKGKIEVLNAELSRMVIREAGRETDGKALNGNAFQITNAEKQSLVMNFSDAKTDPGPEPALVTVRTEKHTFSFFLRDMDFTDTNPIYIPMYGVAVVPGTDRRSYKQIEEDILSRGLLNKSDRTNLKPEASWDQVSPNTRNMSAPIMLGLGRDGRMFRVAEELQDAPQYSYHGRKIITPYKSGVYVESDLAAFTIPEAPNKTHNFCYALGRGMGPLNNIRRWIEDSTLPIYHSELTDDEVVYHSIMFTSLEKEPLVSNPEAQVFPADEEVILYCHTYIVNTSQIPRYAWFRLPRSFTVWSAPEIGIFDPATGFSGFSEESIFCVSQLDGRPVPAEEMAVLVGAGDTINLDFRLSHIPISASRAAALREKSFDVQYAACRAYWQGKLDRAAKITIPEKRIDEMLRACLLHLDLLTFGTNPDEPLAAKVGVYCPIGTESSPIIQYYLSIGLDDIARRSLEYFLARQQDNGSIGSTGHNYSVETGAVLWCIGEYFRYTRDVGWINEIKPKLVKVSEYLMNWRKSDDSGMNLIWGKVADPVDPYRQFMLNGYGYLGMSRMAEMMRELGDPDAKRFADEAANWREAIRKAVVESMGKSPVIPLGNGSWSPTLPPWPEAPGPRLLFQKDIRFYSHGAFTVLDELLGPEYLVFCEVFDPEDPISKMIMTYTAELMCQGNTPFTQPYYSRQNWWQAFSGNVKPFLDIYYSIFSALADRQTYTFWEHFHHISLHKTHEVAGFLMDTRRMLYMERGDTLKLFQVIPRAWMED